MKNSNDLANEKIGSLLFKYAFPSVLSGLVGVAYNLIDQIFIGHRIGVLGSAATNVVFPIITITMAIAIMTGVGCSTAFNLATGKGNLSKAGKVVGNSIVFMLIIGAIIGAISLIFTDQVLWFLGATTSNFDYAKSFLKILAWGIPFSIIGMGGSTIIRSDGSPTYSLICVTLGALVNILLDYCFIFILNLGMNGAALATIIGQILTAVMVGIYFTRFKTVTLKHEDFVLKFTVLNQVIILGMGPLINNLSMFIVQVMLNNALKHYGASSVYGSDIPLACAGVITKIMSLFNAVIIGIAQGVQPIISYNFGAGHYQRVRETAQKAIGVMLIFSFIFFLCCQLIPLQIISVFGMGGAEFNQFAENYMRIFLLFICLIGLQVTAGNIFTSVGRPDLSVAISLTRQVIFFPALILILPQYWGIDGVLYAGPIADGMCITAAIMLLLWGNRKLETLEKV